MKPLAVFDARWILPSPSGIGVYADALARRLPSRLPGLRFEFLVRPDVRDRLAAEWAAAGVAPEALLPVPWGPMSAKSQLLLPRLLRRKGAAVYHSPNFMPPFLAFPRNRRGRTFCLATIHDVIPLVVPGYAPKAKTAKLLFLYRACMRETALRADRVVTGSECARRDIVSALRLGPAAAERVRAVPDGVSAEFARIVRPPAPKAADDPAERTVLYVGRSDPYKNVPALVEAFAKARARAPFPMRLVVAGSRDPRYPEAEERARALGVAEAVRFAGGLPFPELLALYGSADLLAHPSRYEGFGLQIAEAFACGLPVLCTDGGSAPEVAGDAARVVPLSPPGGASFADAFGDAMLALLRDPAELARLSAAGRARSPLFAWDRTADGVAALYPSA